MLIYITVGHFTQMGRDKAFAIGKFFHKLLNCYIHVEKSILTK